ncbi:unnamed protein product [Lampetra fluviatilis]
MPITAAKSSPCSQRRARKGPDEDDDEDDDDDDDAVFKSARRSCDDDDEEVEEEEVGDFPCPAAALRERPAERRAQRPRGLRNSLAATRPLDR